MGKLSVMASVLTLVICYAAHAQLQPKGKQPYSLSPKKEKPYMYTQPLPQTPVPQNFKVVTPQKQSAAADVIVLSNPLTYSHNNGQGFDVYRSNIDGMGVLMPDVANCASLGMSNKNAQRTTIPHIPEKVLQFKGPEYLK
ncbi:MAG: hypothetical protein QM610_05930 [Chitinophagaceae bacterium]